MLLLRLYKKYFVTLWFELGPLDLGFFVVRSWRKFKFDFYFLDFGNTAPFGEK